jgi:hypothetical protein
MGRNDAAALRLYNGFGDGGNVSLLAFVFLSQPFPDLVLEQKFLSVNWNVVWRAL